MYHAYYEQTTFCYGYFNSLNSKGVISSRFSITEYYQYKVSDANLYCNWTDNKIQIVDNYPSSHSTLYYLIIG